MGERPVVAAFMSWGRWVADCPNPACANAMGLERGQTVFRCHIPSGIGVCGTVADVQWPTEPDADDVEQVMADRPPASQSWKQGDPL